MKRIAVNAVLLRPPHAGVETAIVRLIEALATHGRHAYRVLTPRGLPPPVRTVRTEVRLEPAGAPFRSRALRIAWEHVVLPLRLRRMRVDLLHAPAYIAPWSSPVPVVLTVYDLLALDHPEWCRRENALYYGACLPHSIRRAAGIAVPSETTRRDLGRRFPAAASKTRVIPLGLDVVFAPVRHADRCERVRRTLGLPPRFLLFVGQSEPKKNLPALVQACASLWRARRTDLPLVIVGKDGWDRARLQRTIAAEGVADRVVRIPYVPTADLPVVYTLAEAFVFPSLYEGFGLPTLEAMACGTPVVCSDAGALPEVTGDAALLCRGTSPEAIARALQQLLTTPALRTDLRERGLRRAESFSWRAHAERMEALYEDCLLDGNGPEGALASTLEPMPA